MAKVNYSNEGTGEVLGFCRSFLRTAQTLQADLLRSWRRIRTNLANRNGHTTHIGVNTDQMPSKRAFT